jgi:hypothetical protein
MGNDSPVRTTRPPPPQSGSWHRPVAYVAGATGVAAFGAALFFGLRAKSQWADAETECVNGHCSVTGYDGWQDARSTATLGNIAFGAGVALVAAAVVVWLTEPSER